MNPLNKRRCLFLVILLAAMAIGSILILILFLSNIELSHWNMLKFSAMYVTLVSFIFFIILLAVKFKDHEELLKDKKKVDKLPNVMGAAILVVLVLFGICIFSVYILKYLIIHTITVIILFAALCIFELYVIRTLTDGKIDSKILNFFKWKKKLWSLSKSDRNDNNISSGLREIFDNYDSGAFLIFIILLISIILFDKNSYLSYSKCMNEKIQITRYELIASGAFAFHMMIITIQVIREFYTTLHKEMN